MAKCSSKNWDNFWGKDNIPSGTNISWSKKRIIQIVSPYVSKEMDVLDAGCGSGFFSKYFCDQGARTVALDYSQSALDLTRQSTGRRARVVKADLLSSSFRSGIDGAFDLIFSDGLFEHFNLQEQDMIVRNLMSLLRHDGFLVTVVPNRWSPWQLIRPFFMPGIKEDPFVLKGLQHLYERNGLRVISSGGINTLPFLWSPDSFLGRQFGMLLFAVGKKH